LKCDDDVYRIVPADYGVPGRFALERKETRFRLFRGAKTTWEHVRYGGLLELEGLLQHLAGPERYYDEAGHLLWTASYT
jgi:hypothetical protein